MPEALIVRPSLIYGFDPIDKQTAWLVDGIKKANGEVFVDEYRCPIWVDNLAQALLEVAESKLSGILNVAGPPTTQSLGVWIETTQPFEDRSRRLCCKVLSPKAAPNAPPI